MAISLPVQAVPDNRSFDKVADNAEKRFGQAGKQSGKAFAEGLDDAIAKSDPKAVDKWVKAYDRVADAAGKVRTEEAKMAELRSRSSGEAQLVRQSEALERARRAETRAMRDAGEAYVNLGQKSAGLKATLMDLASGTRLGGMVADTQAMAGHFGGVGMAVGATTIAVAGLAIGIGAAAAKLYDLGAKWDDVADSITGRTGKIGADLDAVMDQVTKVAAGSSVGIGKIGDIAGQVTGAIGLTGDQLGTLTDYVADLNELSGQSTNIRELGMLYRVFNVDAADQVDVLNQLYTASTNTQIPVNDLISTMVKAGPAAQELGLSFGQMSSILAEFNSAGVDADAAVKGLRQAFTAFTKAGREPKQALVEVIDEIHNLYATGRMAEGRELAENVFGAKNFAAFIPAIKDGRINVEALGKEFDNTTLDIKETKGATDDLSQRFDNLTNRLEIALKPAADGVFNGLNNSLEWVVSQVEALSDLLSGDFSAVLQRLKDDWNGLFGGGDSGGPWVGGGGDVGGSGGGWFGNSGGTVRGTPGRGFPMPWNLPIAGGGQSYGLPAGTNTGGYGGPGQDKFPQWVLDLGKQFGVQPSTYPGHQEWGGKNHGIDWVGSVEAMDNFAKALAASKPDGLQQVIWQNPQSGERTGLTPDGRVVKAGGEYYRDDWAGHQNHVHTSFTKAAGTVRGTPGQGFPMPWKLGGPGDDDSQTGGLGRSAGIPLNVGTPDTGSGGITSSGTAAPAPPLNRGVQPSGPIPVPRNQTFPLGAATSTPGYGNDGQPGTYVTDPRAIRSAQERQADVNDQITQADQRILDTKEQLADANQRILDAQGAQVAAIQQAAEVEKDPTSSAAQRQAAQRAAAKAQDDVAKATADRDRILNRDIPAAEAARDGLINRSLRDANESLADAQKGRFKPTGKGIGGSGSGIGAPLDADLGLSNGLAGLADNAVRFLANLAFAPMLGALGAVSYASGPTNGAGGLIGMAAMNNGWSGGGGGGGIGGALTALTDGSATPMSHGMMGGAAPGPMASTVSGISPSAGMGGGGFGGVSGMAMDGIMAATAGLDAMAPGAGVAAQIGIQLANRTIAQAGKAAGILAGGVMEATAMPGVDPGESWFGRIAAGFAGAKPALPNKAGGQAAAPGNGQAHGQGNGAAPGPGVVVNYTNNQATEDRAGKDLTNHLTTMYAGPGQ